MKTVTQKNWSKKKINKTTIIAYIVLVFIALFFYIPFIWMVTSSLDANATLSLKVPELTMNNFKYVFTDPFTMKSLFNSLTLGLIVSIVVVVGSTLAAYPLSRFPIRGKKFIIFFLLFMTGLPGLAILVVVYTAFSQIGLIDSLPAVGILMAGSCFPGAIWMMKNFIDTIPVELEESAWVDGAGILQGVWHIIIPALLPGILTIFILNFNVGWGAFMEPFILINSPEKLPAGVTLYQFFGKYGQVDYGKLAAFSFAYITPMLVLFFFAQSHIAKGFRLGGASKG